MRVHIVVDSTAIQLNQEEGSCGNHPPIEVWPAEGAVMLARVWGVTKNWSGPCLSWELKYDPTGEESPSGRHVYIEASLEDIELVLDPVGNTRATVAQVIPTTVTRGNGE